MHSQPKYYVENNHPAIIDSATFGRVQEEMARRCGKRKVKQVGTKTEQGRYSSKYALTELLICGECGTPYRRCTWAANGKKKVVWRCINRLDYGKKYCHYSPSIEESVLQEAIMKAVMQTAKQNAEVLKTLKLHIGMGLSAGTTEDNSLDLQIRIAEIEAEFQKMLKAIAADNVEAFDEEKAKALMDEKAKLQIQLDRIADTKQKRENAKSRLDEIFTIIEALANHPISYDDQIVRHIQNRYLEANNRPERVDLRSYARQGLDIVPTVHEGAAVQQMEKRGIQTNIGNLNREIKAANRLMQSIRQLIQNLKGWITELGEKRKELLAQKTAEEATLLPNLLMKYMEIRKEERKDWTRAGQNRGTSQDLKAVSEALSYLRQKGLSTVEDLEAFLESSGKSAADYRNQMKPKEARSKVIDGILASRTDCKECKPVYEKYQKIFFKKTKEKFKQEHPEVPGMKKPPPTLPSTQMIRTVPKRSCKRSRKRFWKKSQS